MSLFTAQQRQVQDSGLQRQRFSSSPVTGANDPCCNWREALTGHPCAPKSNAHTTHPSICTEAKLSPDEIYTIYPKRQRSYLLGTWDPRPDFQQEPAAPIALKYWGAVTPAFCPYKINHSEGEKKKHSSRWDFIPWLHGSARSWALAWHHEGCCSGNAQVPEWRRSSWKSQDL